MKLKTELKLAHISGNLELNGQESGDVGYALKLSSEEMGVADLAGLFRTPAAFALLVEGMYNDEGELKTHDVGQIEMLVEGVGIKAKIKSQFGTTLEFDEKACFNKIKYTLHPGRVCEFSARLQVHPNEDQMGVIWKMLGQGVTISVSGKTADPATIEKAQRGLALEEGSSQGDEPAAAGGSEEGEDGDEGKRRKGKGEPRGKRLQ